MGRSATKGTLVLANISVGRCIFAAVGVLTLAAVPNVPGFGDGLTYFAFFYTTTLGVVLRLFASGVLVLIGASLVYGGGVAILGSARGVWLEDGNLAWGRIGTKRVSVTSLRSATYAPNRQCVVLERCDGRSAMLIPTMGLRSSDAPEPLVARLRELISAS